MREGRRLMDEWQSEGYGKHADNTQRRRDAEKSQLRFELTVRDKRLTSKAAQTAAHALELSQGVDQFEKTLRRLSSDGGGGGGGSADGDDASQLVTTDASPAEHLAKLERLLPTRKAQEVEARTYMEKLRSRRVEEQSSRKEREVRRRKLMLEQAQAQAALDERRRDELLLSKLSRQCATERELAEQLWRTRQEKEVMRENRLLREQQYEERRARDGAERRARDRELNARANADYKAALALEAARAAEVEAARQLVKRQTHEALCRGIATQLAALASRAVDVRASARPLLPPKVMRDWLTLFAAGVPLTRVGIDTPHADEEQGMAPPADAPPELLLHESELDVYLEHAEEWHPEALALAPLPDELAAEVGAPGSLLDASLVAPSEAEAGCALVGRMVLDLIETTTPPPPPPPPPVVGPSLTRLAVVGKPFAGKSLLAQALAEAFNLRVLMPQDVVQAAVGAALRAQAEAATAEAAAAAEPPEEGSVAALGLAAATTLQEGGTLPDEVMVGLMVEAIRATDPVSYAGFVLDGFPRSAAQAKLLEKGLTGYSPAEKEAAKPKGSKLAPPPDDPDAPPEPPHVAGIDAVLRLDVADEAARRRALGRRLDPQTGVVYHLEFEPPPDAHDVNERLVPLLGASNQEAQLQPALTAYADGEAELAEWLTSLAILAPLEAEGTLDEVQSGAIEAVEALLVRKREAAAIAEAAAAERAAAEAEAAAAAAEQAAAEAAAAEAQAAAVAAAEEAGEEPPAPPEPTEPPEPATAAAPAAVPPDAAGGLLSQWKAVEADFVGRARLCLGRLRETQWLLLQRATAGRAEFVQLLRAPDGRQLEVSAAQERFNALPNELRLEEAGKAELHMVVEEAQERLWALSDEKRHAAERLLAQMSEDEWLAHHAQRVLLALVELAQAEADRHVATAALLLDYCSLRCEEPLSFPGGGGVGGAAPGLPGLAELPLPEGVGLSVPLPVDPSRSRPPTSDAAAAAAKDAKGGKGGKDKAPAKGGGKDAKGAPALSSEPPEALLLTSLAAAAALHAEPEAAPEEPPPADDAPPPTAEELRVAEWKAYLARAAGGERAKLRRRLAAIARFGGYLLGDVRDTTGAMYAQLDDWLGQRLRQETASASSLVSILRAAIESELPLPHQLRLDGEALQIDEALLLLPPPAPPPPPPLAQRQLDATFTVAQLAGLASKLRDAASGLTISTETLGALLTRLASAGFDAAAPLVPPSWQSLTAPAYAKLAALYGAASATVAWPELVVALAATRMPTEAELSAMMVAAATAAGRAELLPGAAPAEPAAAAPAEGAEEGAAAAEGGEEAAPAPPAPPAPLVLTRAQYDEVPLWFEAEAGAGDAFPVAAKLKQLLFEMLCTDGTEALDMEQLLLYCCDSPAKAFALVGFQTSGLLTLPQLHRLFHREGGAAVAAADLAAPTHADPWSTEALLRLFAELKLDASERCAYSLVAPHPLGKLLLEQCASYTPKAPYALVAEVQAVAGQALTM